MGKGLARLPLTLPRSPGVAMLLLAAGISQRDGAGRADDRVFRGLALLAYSAGQSFNFFG